MLPVRVRTEMLRKLAMGLVVCQGCMGRTSAGRLAGEYDVQPPLGLDCALGSARRWPAKSVGDEDVQVAGAVHALDPNQLYVAGGRGPGDQRVRA